MLSKLFLNFIGILPKRKDGSTSDSIFTKLQHVIDEFDSKSNDKGYLNLIKILLLK